MIQFLARLPARKKGDTLNIKEVINLPDEQPAPQTQPAPQAQPVAKTSDDNLMAALSYVSILSVVMLFVKKDSELVQFHAKQGIVIFVVEVVLGVFYIPLLFIPVLGWMLNSLGWLVLIIASIVGFIKAYSGERYRLPLVADIADKINI